MECTSQRWTNRGRRGMLSTIWMAKRIKCVQISKHNTVYLIWLIMPASLTLYPPHEKCTNPDCQRVNVLKKAEFRQVVVYSMNRGACRAWSVHLFCPGKNPYMSDVVIDTHQLNRMPVKLSLQLCCSGWDAHLLWKYAEVSASWRTSVCTR